MFNTIIQPTGVYGGFLTKQPAVTGLNTQIPTKESPGKTKESAFTEPEPVKKKKSRFFVKLIALAFTAIGVIWGLPSIKNAVVKKEVNLPKIEEELAKKELKLLDKGKDAVQKDLKAVAKERKVFERDKKIFKIINKHPFLLKSKNKFIKLATNIESKIQKPLAKFIQENIFAYLQKKS